MVALNKPLAVEQKMTPPTNTNIKEAMGAAVRNPTIITVIALNEAWIAWTEKWIACLEAKFARAQAKQKEVSEK